MSAQAEAWNQGDAKALAAGFAADGEFIASDGSVVVGREEFTKRQAERFRTIRKDRRLWIKLRSMRELGTSGMVADTDHEISTDAGSATPGNGAERTVECRLRVRYVFAKAEGRWWIAGLQETEVKEAAALSDGTDKGGRGHSPERVEQGVDTAIKQKTPYGNCGFTNDCRTVSYDMLIRCSGDSVRRSTELER